MKHFSERPCAAKGLTSYRARSPYGFIMIGATSDANAAREASRSSKAWHSLQVWDSTVGNYVEVQS